MIRVILHAGQTSLVSNLQDCDKMLEGRILLFQFHSTEVKRPLLYSIHCSSKVQLVRKNSRTNIKRARLFLKHGVFRHSNSTIIVGQLSSSRLPAAGWLTCRGRTEGYYSPVVVGKVKKKWYHPNTYSCNYSTDDAVISLQSRVAFSRCSYALTSSEGKRSVIRWLPNHFVPKQR